MFQAMLLRCSPLREVMFAIEDILTDVTFECTTRGIDVKAMDAAGFTLVYLCLKSGGFTEYKCRRNFSTRVILGQICTMFRAASPDDSFCMKATDNLESILYVFQSAITKRYVWYKRKIINMDDELLDVPNAPYLCIIRMSSRELAKVCTDLSTIGKLITLSTSPDSIRFTASGNNRHVAYELTETKPELNEENAVVINQHEPVSLTITRCYAINFVNSVPLNERVQLSMAREGPLVCEYRISDLGYLRFYMAPKTEGDDDFQEMLEDSC
nr:proliferating cell nuclear antigen-like [Megalopta genalis]